jgi:hypothetical protein
MTILGFWKVIGATALLAPRFLRLKEWAYAGIFFNVTGAAASHGRLAIAAFTDFTFSQPLDFGSRCGIVIASTPVPLGVLVRTS